MELKWKSDPSLNIPPPGPLCLFFSHLPERLPSFLRPSDPDQISKGEKSCWCWWVPLSGWAKDAKPLSSQKCHTSHISFLVFSSPELPEPGAGPSGTNSLTSPSAFYLSHSLFSSYTHTFPSSSSPQHTAT